MFFPIVFLLRKDYLAQWLECRDLCQLLDMTFVIKIEIVLIQKIKDLGCYFIYVKMPAKFMAESINQPTSTTRVVIR